MKATKIRPLPAPARPPTKTATSYVPFCRTFLSGDKVSEMTCCSSCSLDIITTVLLYFTYRTTSLFVCLLVCLFRIAVSTKTK